MPLLDWLEQCALPEEARLADPAYAGAVAPSSCAGWPAPARRRRSCSARTSPPAVDALFTEADGVGLRITSRARRSATGSCARDLLTTPERAYDEGRALAERWHGTAGSATPSRRGSRSPPATRCWSRARRPARRRRRRVVHLPHQREPAEIAAVRELFPGTATTSTPTTSTGWSSPRQRARPQRAPDRRRAGAAGRARAQRWRTARRATRALGSGLFPLRRHLEHGVRVALGTDVGAGTGFSLLKEGLQAYFMQQLLGRRRACR